MSVYPLQHQVSAVRATGQMLRTLRSVIRRRWLCAVLPAVFVVVSAPVVHAQAPTAAVVPGGALEVRPLADGVWLHTSFQEVEGYGRVSSNGLLVVSDGEVLLVDTAWGDGPTESLLDWIADSLGASVARAVLTHAHDDRMGGINALVRAGVVTYALDQTSRLAAEQGWPRADSALAGLQTVPVGSWRVEVFYPGPAHTPDNIVVWLPEQRVLFGGCMIRAAGARSLGNLGDAVVEEWEASAARLHDRYRSAEVVVPAHGPPGDVRLIEHTLRLAAQLRER